MDSADFLSFVLFTLITVPCLLIPPEHLRRPMLISAVCSTITAFSLFIYSLAKGKGAGPLLGPEGFALIGVEPAKGSNLA
jgi:NCS1 family nucleobase:cation symporter-1